MKASLMPRDVNPNILIYKLYSLILKIDPAKKLSLSWIYLQGITLNFKGIGDVANLLP